MPLQVFICGITGTQGGALARQLLASHPAPTVHGLARDPTSASATALTTLGAKLFPGSYDDGPALRAALAGCTSIFLNLRPESTDPGCERRHALAILAAASEPASSVQHVVYSSALSANAPEKLPRLEEGSFIASMLREKQFVEGALRGSGVPKWTILRPGNFMSNYTGAPARERQGELVSRGVLVTAFAEDTKIPTVDPETIAAFARAAMLDGDRFNGKEIALADELITLQETLSRFGAVAGRELRAEYLSDAEIEVQKRANPFVGAMYAMRDMAQFVDLDEVKTWGVTLSSVGEFVKREAASIKETYRTKGQTT